jgi:hypothetical protein
MTMSIGYFTSILAGMFLGELVGWKIYSFGRPIETEICIHSAETHDSISKGG